MYTNTWWHYITIRNSKIFHFADVTNLLSVNECPGITKQICKSGFKKSHKLAKCKWNILECLKTELVIFKPKRQRLSFDLKLKLNGKILYPTGSVKYFRFKIYSKLTWKVCINDIVIKLVRVNEMVYKIHDYLNHNRQ